MEKTLSIIKPDATKKGIIGKILGRFENSGLRIAAMKKLQLNKEWVGRFHTVHKERSFFKDLMEFMISSPVVVSVLGDENAVPKDRGLMDVTNPREARAGTIRADFAENIDASAVHENDSLENAETEIDFFFKPNEIC